MPMGLKLNATVGSVDGFAKRATRKGKSDRIDRMLLDLRDDTGLLQLVETPVTREQPCSPRPIGRKRDAQPAWELR
jgi:hypothetical protein